MNPNLSADSRGPSRRIIEKELSHAIVHEFFSVYNDLGYGFVEPIYSRALEIALRQLGLVVEREYPIAVTFRAQQVGFHRVDMLVERRVIVEIKSTERLPESARRQLRSYVTALKQDLGLLLHFGPAPKFYRILGGWRSTQRTTDSG
jgi:GxxExxY protein